MAALFGFVITTFFGSINPYKHGDEAQQWFLRDLSFTSTKDINLCQHVKTFGCKG
jgi:hypothetical protein